MSSSCHPYRPSFLRLPFLFALGLGLVVPVPVLRAESTTSLFARGKEAVRVRHFDAAVALFEQALLAEPGSSSHHQWLARALGLRAQEAGITKSLGALGKIRSEMERAIELDPNNLEARSDLLLYYTAVPRLLGGNRAKADEQLAEIRKRDAALAAQIDGDLAASEKKPDEALAAYLRAARLAPGRAMPYVRIALVHQFKKEWDQSFAYLERALKAEPRHPMALFQVGRTGALSGQQLERAEAALRTYLTLKLEIDDPSFAAAHHRLGNILEKKSDVAAARREYETALRLDPKNKAARASLDKLKA